MAQKKYKHELRFVEAWRRGGVEAWRGEGVKEWRGAGGGIKL